jgi:two-component system response regulator
MSTTDVNRMQDKRNPTVILVVEDSPDDYTIFEFAVQQSGIENPIYHVEDGATALDWIFGVGKYEDRDLYPEPGLVFLDINLPKVNGLQVLAEMRMDKKLQALPAVMLTVSDSDHDVFRSYELDSMVYVRKPVTADNLVSICKALPSLSMHWSSSDT